MSDSSPFETTLRVRYKDTDAMGVVYHSNYLVFFEVGRTELLRRFGCIYSDMEARGFLLAVVDCSARFTKSARYDDLLTVRTRLANFKGPRVRLEYEVCRDGEVLVTGHTEHVVLLRDGFKPVRPPADLQQALERTLAAQASL